MKVLLSLIVFSTLLSAGMALRCYSSGRNGTKLQNCEAFVPKCASLSYIQTVMRYTKNGDYKLCAPESCVTGEIGFSSAKGKRFYMNTKCCNTNACNTDFVGLPAQEPNGMKCPACFLFKEKDCISSENITCKSTETQCIDFTGSFGIFPAISNDFTMKGCATPSFCDVSKRSFENGGKQAVTTLYVSVKSTKAHCYPALSESETDLE